MPSPAGPTKAKVLAKVNQLLEAAGLYDRVHSLRDCDSTLFHLVWKKLFLTKLQINAHACSNR